MSKRHSPRSARIGDEIQRELMTLLREEVKDPRVGRVTVTHVEVTSDMSHAKVLVTDLAGREHAAETVAALARTAGRFDNLLQQVAHNRLQGHNLGWLTGLDIEEDAFDRFHRLPVHRRSRRGWRWGLVALRSRRLCRSRGRLLFDDCRTRLRRRGCAHVQSALRIDGDDVNAVPFELNDVVGVGDQPFVEQKRRSVPGLIEARDKHADRELINGNAFSRVHIRVRLKPRRDGVVGKRYRYVQLSRNIYR